ncbi:MAG: hypothetical protein OXF04_04055, partial [bacterium]|nr:hypothetical protein [bacterium]
EHMPSSLGLSTLQPPPLNDITFVDLLSITNFGLVSLLDLMCVVEAAQNLGYFQEPALAHPYAQSHSALAAHSALPAQDPPEPPDPTEVAWSTATVVLQRLLTAASEISGARTLADALSGDLGGLAAKLGMADHLGEISLPDLTGEPQLAHESLSALTELWESLPHVEQTILHKRILAANPLTLEELGEAADLTRERIRQIEKRIESRLNHPSISGPAVNCWIGMLAILLQRTLGPITTPRDVKEQVSAIFPIYKANEDATFHIDEMARYLLHKELDYVDIDDLLFDKYAIALVDAIKTIANSIADEFGLVDETEIESLLPDATAHISERAWKTNLNALIDEHWESLLSRCGLYRLHGTLALQDTSKTRTVAALLAIGRPATKEEIGELSGLRPDRVGAQLSLLPGVVRADKHRWGLAEWVDDEYEGIPAEIIQRINEDGGSTRLSRLLEELPRMFGVAESSVKAYLDTPAFQVEHGWVREADNPTFLLHRLEDVIDGYDDNGDPYWEFEIEDRHLEGYSLHEVPLEVAGALECGFGNRTTARVLNPANCQKISVIWRKTSMRGPEIGRLGQSLIAIGAQGGDEVRLIIHNTKEVSFERVIKDTGKLQTHQSTKPDETSDTDATTTFKGIQIGTPITARIIRDSHTSPDEAAEPGERV